MRDLGTSDKRLGLRAPLVVRKKEKFKMSSSLSIFRDQSAQVPVYFEIATCLPLMNMSRIVILYLACTFISFPLPKNSYEESKPGNIESRYKEMYGLELFLR